MAMRLRRERHSVTDLKAHLVCVTKYREHIFSVDEFALIEAVFRYVAKQMNFEVLEISGESDHIHALIEYPPKLSYLKDCERLERGV